MKNTVTALVVVVAAAGLGTTALAQGRHDERPHGYNDKVAAEQMASTVQPRTTYFGPRAHDNSLQRFMQTARVQKNEPTTVAKAQQ